MNIYAPITEPMPTGAISLYVASFFPWMRHHKQQLRTFIDKSSYCPVVCVLHPSPFLMLRQLNRDETLPHVENLDQLVERLSSYSSVLICKMTSDDLTAKPSDFFDGIFSQCEVAEVWLRQNQTLGRGMDGSVEGLRTSLGKKGCSVLELPRIQESVHKIEAFAALRRGAVQVFHDITGVYPSLLKQNCDMKLSWADGIYFGTKVDDKKTVTIEVKDGMIYSPSMEKDGKNAITVVSGPGDIAPK